MNKEFYDIKVLKQDGSFVDLHEYEGKVLLIVNTATGCGYTPHYEGLQAMYDELKDKGFEILDFPCNQFKDQTPGTDAEINQFCSLKYHTTFPRYKKVEIIGENKIELYKYLETKAPFKGKGLTISMLKKLSGAKDNEVRWNFTKFLVDREGNVIDRFEPTDDMNKKVLKRVKEVVEK